MTLRDFIARLFDGEPVVESAPRVDWRDQKLIEAAAKKDGAFKCGPASVPREIIVDGKVTTLRPGEKPKATVTAIATRRKTK